jgi:DNA-binding NarL/FixJ family response regulator|tara:strand:- start:359 stop:523 length:165 start_codon:yes stop_codon:yes gene_type:complete
LVRFIKNGIETRIALRRLDRHKETVIVMLTTETERRIVQSVSAYNGSGYVVKES